MSQQVLNSFPSVYISTNVSNQVIYTGSGTLVSIIIAKAGVTSNLALTDGTTTWNFDTTVARPMDCSMLINNLIATTTGGTAANIILVYSKA